MVRVVALFEAGKGALVIVAGLGLLSLIHQDVQRLAASSGGIYIPFEIYELYQNNTLLSIGALLLNILIVGLMIQALWKTRHMSSSLRSA